MKAWQFHPKKFQRLLGAIFTSELTPLHIFGVSAMNVDGFFEKTMQLN